MITIIDQLDSSLFTIINPSNFSPDIKLVSKKQIGQTIKNESINKGALRVLDVGGGTGGRIPNLLKSEDNFSVLEIDSSFAGPGVIIGDACNCPQVGKNSFDIVISVNLLEHVFEPWSALKEMTRIVKDQGIIAIMRPFLGGIIHFQMIFIDSHLNALNTYSKETSHAK